MVSVLYLLLCVPLYYSLVQLLNPHNSPFTYGYPMPWKDPLPSRLLYTLLLW
ncbi:unnamed protein product [Musa acuminata subsp. burmannicoides]